MAAFEPIGDVRGSGGTDRRAAPRRGVLLMISALLLFQIPIQASLQKSPKDLAQNVPGRPAQEPPQSQQPPGAGAGREEPKGPSKVPPALAHRRYIQFDSEVSLGWVAIRPHPEAAELLSLPDVDPSWQIGPVAIGVVRIPPLHEAMLIVDKDAAPALGCLDKVGPDSLQTIRMSGCRGVDEALPHLKGLQGMHTLELDHSDLSDAGAVHLAALSNLKCLDLRGTRVTDRALSFVGRIRSLRELLLPAGQTAAGLSRLSELSELKRLNLSGDANLSDDALKPIASIRSLETLNVSGTGVGDAGMAYLAEMPALKELDAARTKIADKGLASLARIKSLRRLDLAGTAITSEGFHALGEMRKLDTLILATTAADDRALEALKPLYLLTTLSLSRTAITDAGLAHLKELPSLQSLYLSQTKITDAAIDALAAMRGLKRLALQGTGITPKGCDRLRRALPEAQILDGSRSPSSAEMKPQKPEPLPEPPPAQNPGKKP